jgi:2,4-dichlorophenol 6-monooxygenase
LESLRGLRAREVGEDGCVLVRPDMHIAWRANADDAAAEPLDVMSRILPLPI